MAAYMATGTRDALLGHVGLSRPYRFERTLVALCALALALCVAAAAAGLAAFGELSLHAPRAGYFFWLIGLLGVAALLARWPKLAALPLAVAALDLALGLSSMALRPAGSASFPLMPNNFYLDRRFEWHPLLQGVPIPSISVDVSGFRVSHSAERTRGRDYRPEDLAGRKVVAVFGGSATYEISVGDADTWPVRLETELGAAAYAVINHGVPGYATPAHLMQTAFYQRKFGVAPNCALYFIGWNDIRSAHIQNLDPGYARFHQPSILDALQARRYGSSFMSFSPLITVSARLLSSWIDTARLPEPAVGEPKSGSDPALEAIYLSNVRAISAINRERGIRTIWVGQILNLPLLQNDEINGWMPLVRNRDAWPLLSRFNDILARQAGELGDAYVKVPIEVFQSSDFRDNGHFVAPGSAKFARLLAPEVARECR
jgi:hypothetical protein